MTLLLVFVGCLFTVFTLWLMIAPFVGEERGLRLEHLDEEIREIEQLVARRQVLLTGLRELDFDRETDKIAIEDYERFRRRYEAEAVAIMRRLDEIHGGRDWQQRVDEQLEERLGRPPQIRGADQEPEEEAVEDEDLPQTDEDDEAAAEDGAEADANEDEVEEEEATAMVVDLDDSTPLRCIECDSLLADDDKFCSQCGMPVPVATEQPDQPAKSEASA